MRGHCGTGGVMWSEAHVDRVGGGHVLESVLVGYIQRVCGSRLRCQTLHVIRLPGHRIRRILYHRMGHGRHDCLLRDHAFRRKFYIILLFVAELFVTLSVRCSLPRTFFYP